MNNAEKKTGTKAFQLVTFHLGAEEFGIRIEVVQEIVRTPEITALPRTQKFVKGIINLRGSIIPVIDMRERFGMEAGTYSDRTRAIVVRINGRETGLIVDDVSQVLEADETQIEPPPEIVRNVSTDFIDGIVHHGNSMIVLLKTDNVVAGRNRSDPEKRTDSDIDTVQGGRQ